MGNKYVTIIDNTGRNIIGSVSAETATTITLKNPVMISIQPQGDKFQVQLIPLFLTEFIDGGPTGVRPPYSYVYNRSSIAVGVDFNIDGRIIDQYLRISQTATTPVQGDKPEVIKLFSE